MSETSGRSKPCPICEAPAKVPFVPFCSDRCKQIDLNRWLSAGYAIPGNPTDDDSDGLPGPEDLDSVTSKLGKRHQEH